VKIIKLTENKDGSCSLELDMSLKEKEMLLEYAFVELIKIQIKKEENGR
jgi:hypothetical protein